LPSLETFAPTGEKMTMCTEDKMDDDGFGDFEGPGELLAGAQDDVVNNNEHGTANYDASEVVDDNNGFGDFNDTVVKTEENNIHDDQLFGDFEVHAQEAVDDHNIEYAASESAIAANGNEFAASANGNDLTLFDVFSEIPPPPLSASFSAEQDGEDIVFDDFGGHDDEQAPAQNNNDEDESFGQFEAFPAAVNEDVQNNNDEDEKFGQFGAPTDAKESPDYNTTSPANNEEDESFGQFETVPAAVLNEAIAQSNDEDESFGQFDASFPAAATSNEDESFGQFEAHANEVPGDNVSPSVDNIVDDSGTFQGVNTDDTAGDAVLESNNDDFGDGFGDFSSFDDATTSQQPESDTKKGDLEEILRSNLGDEYGKLPGMYSSIITAVENDLQRGNKIMDYVSNTLSSKDKAFIIKSRKLRDHISGLAEFVRIVRSITATIGELLGVNKNIDVQESTLTQWNDNAIIADVIVVEYLWSEIISKAVALGIVSQAPQLESVVEIRARGDLSFDDARRQKDDFCQLTLQPLLEEETSSTRSPVVWNGKKYMACAANFCANRVPEISI